MAFCIECKCCQAQPNFELCIFCEDGVACPNRQRAAARIVTAPVAPPTPLVAEKTRVAVRRIRNPKSPWRAGLTLSDNAPLKPATTDSAPALQDEAAKPQQVVQVPTAGKDLQEEKKERTNMRLKDEERAQRKSCACGMLLRKDNPDGACRDCRKAAKKEASANGAPSPKKGRPIKTKATPPRNSVSSPAPRAASQPLNGKDRDGIATICVTETNLNAFWMQLSLEEKASLFQRQLEGA